MRPKLYYHKLCKREDSMDHDDISMWVLSSIAPQVVKPLVYIFDLSFSTGIFRVHIAKVKPLFKNGNKSDFSNYTCITVLEDIGKIIQRATTTILEYK